MKVSMSHNHNLNAIQAFRPISLEEMDSAALMNRVDTKFVFHQKYLPSFLGWLHESYRVLEINNYRSISYHSLYFDTPELVCIISIIVEKRIGSRSVTGITKRTTSHFSK